jgi:endonuclease G
MELHLRWLVGSLFFLASYVLADTSVKAPSSVTQGRPNPNCPQFQIYGYPSIADPKILRRGFYTCRIGYAGLYDPAERIPLWVAEQVKKSNFSGNAERDQLDFFQDTDIPVDALPRASDYAGSGFDKGHMAPAANFKSSQVEMNATFRFANAVPQTPESNRGVWKQLEDATRELAIRRGDLYVVTGPVFLQSPRVKLKNRISIPDATYKIIVDPKRQMMTGFVIPNNSSLGQNFRSYQVKVREIERLTGLNFNPDLPRKLADEMEAVQGGDWPMPNDRKKLVN